jgi:hypothetical protein
MIESVEVLAVKAKRLRLLMCGRPLAFRRARLFLNLGYAQWAEPNWSYKKT